MSDRIGFVQLPWRSSSWVKSSSRRASANFSAVSVNLSASVTFGCWTVGSITFCLELSFGFPNTAPDQYNYTLTCTTFDNLLYLTSQGVEETLSLSSDCMGKFFRVLSIHCVHCYRPSFSSILTVSKFHAELLFHY